MANISGFVFQQAVVDCDAYIAFGRVFESGIQKGRSSLVPISPTAPVNEDDCWSWGFPPVGRHGKVEFPGLITFAVGDVWHEGHALGQAFPDLRVGGQIKLALGSERKGDQRGDNEKGGASSFHFKKDLGSRDGCLDDRLSRDFLNIVVVDWKTELRR